MKLYVVEITLRGREEDVEYVAREISQLKYKKVDVREVDLGGGSGEK